MGSHPPPASRKAGEPESGQAGRPASRRKRIRLKMYGPENLPRNTTGSRSGGRRNPASNRAPLPKQEATLRMALFDLAPALLAVSLARQGLLDAALLPWFQVERVALYFLNDVFLLHLPLEPAKGVLEGFPLLKPHFSHAVNTPSASQSLLRLVIIGIYLPKSSDFIFFFETKDRGDSKPPQGTASLILPAVIALPPSAGPTLGKGCGPTDPRAG
jgi:hypothetical protein